MKIGELASATGTKVETVRYYEKIGILPPPARSPANYRSYDVDHLARLSFIRRARELGFTLEAVRELLTLSDDKNQSCEAVDRVARSHLGEIDRKIADLAELRAELGRVIGSCSHGTVADCKIIETLAPRAAARA
jgi:Cu(I)-responsive transcriptional regulator